LQQQEMAADVAPRYEYAAAALLMLLLTPYLLVYDLALLLVPIAYLWSSPDWRMGIVLYASITLVGALLYLRLDFSLVPFLELIVLARMAASLRSAAFAARSARFGTYFPAVAARPANG
jgi:hypothetical protein